MMTSAALPASMHHGAASPAGLVTVASVPAGHPYVARICASPEVALLPDPPVAGADAGVWWPPPALDSAWIVANRSAAQVLHIHFGTESFTPGHLASAMQAAREAGWPVVFTAHDLEHPQLSEQTTYSQQLDVLVRGADAVITLTPGAAAVVAQRWNRQALVIRHPSVLPADAVIPAVRTTGSVLIGMHLKDLRPNVDGPCSVRMLLDSAARLRAEGVPAVSEIRLHHQVRDEAARESVRRLCAEDDYATLVEHERLSDAELTVALSRLDAYVLPYRHGTHSGWLELCWDLGVPVAAPAVGHYAEQHDDGSIASFQPGDAASLTDALDALLSEDVASRAGTPERVALCAARREERRRSDASGAAAHAALYRYLIDRMVH